MSNMGDLDIVLSEHKLSDAQKNAIVELLSPESGDITAKPNTLKSLERKGLVTSYAGGGWQLADEFRAELNLKTGTAESVESLLQGDPWGVKAVQDVMLTPVEDVKPETFDYQLGVYSNTLMGFGEVYKWNNVIVWDGLNLQEIKEDIKTAFPVNRKARREHAKMTRRLIKAAIGAL